MRLYDGHAHIGTPGERLVRRNAGITTMICAGTPEEGKELDRLAKGAESWIVPAAGLHPWYADRYRVEDMIPYLERFPVIGEIGLDSVWCDVPMERQRAVFEEQLALASQLGKPVVLHTKGMEREIAERIRKYPNRYLVHWYSSLDDLDLYLSQDCYFTLGPDLSVNPAVRQAAERAPIDRLMVETDGFSAVTWALGERSLEELPGILEANMTILAEIRGMTAEEVEEKLEENFRRFILLQNAQKTN